MERRAVLDRDHCQNQFLDWKGKNSSDRRGPATLHLELGCGWAGPISRHRRWSDGRFLIVTTAKISSSTGREKILPIGGVRRPFTLSWAVGGLGPSLVIGDGATGGS